MQHWRTGYLATDQSDTAMEDWFPGDCLHLQCNETVSPVLSEDIPHDGRRREPLAAALPKSYLYLTVALLMDRCFVKYVLISLDEETEFDSNYKVSDKHDCGCAVTPGPLLCPQRGTS
jgi:hypothetical protein